MAVSPLSWFQELLHSPKLLLLITCTLWLLQANGWTVGDFCQAVFTEDGTVYRAKILSINPDDNTCVVRYLGYGNEEEQSLDDLIPNDSSSRKQRRSDSVSFSEVNKIWNMWTRMFAYQGCCLVWAGCKMQKLLSKCPKHRRHFRRAAKCFHGRGILMLRTAWKLWKITETFMAILENFEEESKCLQHPFMCAYFHQFGTKRKEWVLQN